ncbi:methionyl-tRNA formyltransferase [Buchnera aphidicola (Melanaphis sacchari)]|uniref:Methionyl-tRNA formyltransferase n=1 Tax=Buchnera aphidicola (Melanaphis sacchari) TaxID=2173854 RepID=A0A2U8DG19_9GAMM|nr:methionyl-tRNA formyltransferase [Buchnera aphidicola]AWH90758.1 methionyl-tRNA formyltransferase [Buchnera aphidicola (Melanaphis sacchari)]
MKTLKIIFAGTDHFSEQHLNALIQKKYKIIAVISQPDRFLGRGLKKVFSPVKMLSIKNKIPIIQPITLNNKKIQKKISNFNADIMIVVSYGQIIPKEILTMFLKGCINLHPSLLPRWRGPTPIQSSILFNDKETGISIIKMNEKIDDGNIIYSSNCQISSKDTTETLSFKLAKIGIQGLLKTLEKINNNDIFEIKQNEKYVTFSKKIFKKNALLDWNKEAHFLERLIRAFNPWPICYFIVDTIVVRVWEATVITNIQSNVNIGEILCYNKYGIQIQTAKNILNIQKIQFPGKKIAHVKTMLDSKKNFFCLKKII